MAKKKEDVVTSEEPKDVELVPVLFQNGCISHWKKKGE